jgi:hypothetical protein
MEEQSHDSAIRFIFHLLTVESFQCGTHCVTAFPQQPKSCILHFPVEILHTGFESSWHLGLVAWLHSHNNRNHTYSISPWKFLCPFLLLGFKCCFLVLLISCLVAYFENNLFPSIGRSSDRPFVKVWNGSTAYFSWAEDGEKWLEDIQNYNGTLVLTVELWDAVDALEHVPTLVTLVLLSFFLRFQPSWRTFVIWPMSLVRI